MNRTYSTRFVLGAVAFGAVIAATVTQCQHADAHPATPTACAGTVVLALDGTKGPTTPDSIDPASPLNAYADAYRAQPDTIVRHVAYPGGMLAGVNGWDANLDQSVEIGAQNLRREIAATDAACGRHTRYVLLGFSQGNMVVRKVANEIDSDRIYDDGTDLQDRVQVVRVADPADGLPAQFTGPLVDGVTLPNPAVEFQNIPDVGICAPDDLVCDPQGTLIGYMTRHGDYYRLFVDEVTGN
jgi:cutinase